MKKQTIVLGLALVVSALLPTSIIAQGGLTQQQTVTMAVTGSALIRVMKGTSDAATGVSLTLGGPAEAGLQVNPVSEDISTRLRISSLAAGATAYRQIKAGITTGNMEFSRTKLELELQAPAAGNSANFINYDPEGGVVQGLQNLGDNTGNQGTPLLVKDILTCWSGTADGDGYVIHYKYSATGGGTPTARSVVVTFTIEAQP